MTFHDGWIRETLYGAMELQLLASALLVVALVLVLEVVRKLRVPISVWFNSDVAEIVEMVAMAAAVVVVSYLLADVWGIAFLLHYALDVVVVDRWTGMQQVVTVSVLVIAYLLVRVVNRSIDRLRQEGAITRHQKEVAYHVADLGIFAVAGIVVLSLWGVDPSSVIISAGVATAVLGLAAQRTVAATIAGFVLLFSRPFRVGDWIEVVDDGGGEEGGVVQDVTLFHTKIRTFNDEHVLVPNHEVTSNRLTNYSRSNKLRLDVEVDVDYETDLDRAAETLTAAVDDLDAIEPSPEPRAVLKRFGDSSIVFELQFWIDNPSRRRAWNAQTAAITAVKDAFDREGIVIPFPQRTHVSRDEGGFRVNGPTSLAESATDVSGDD